jgi:hypothetical protein
VVVGPQRDELDVVAGVLELPRLQGGVEVRDGPLAGTLHRQCDLGVALPDAGDVDRAA